MLKKLMLQITSVIFLVQTASCSINQHISSNNELEAVCTLLQKRGYSSEDITQFLLDATSNSTISHSVQPRSKLKFSRDALICFAFGATVGIATLALGTLSFYLYSHHEKASRLPSPDKDLPRNSNKLGDISLSYSTRYLTNLAEMPCRDFYNGRFTTLHALAADKNTSANDIRDAFQDRKKNNKLPDIDYNAQIKEDANSYNFQKNADSFAGIKGSTPLALAALAHNKEKVDLFLEYGSNPSIRDCNGNTALHNAVANINPSKNSQIDSVRALVQADPNLLTIKNNAGLTPLEYMTIREKTRKPAKNRTPKSQKQFDDLKKLLSLQK